MRQFVFPPLVIGIMWLPVGAAAQEASEGLPDIVVFGKAIGAGENYANVEITPEQLRRLPAGADVQQALKRISGIDVGSSSPLGGGGFDSTINMRGFAKDSIGFSVDGIPIGRTTLGGGAVPNRFMDASNLQGVVVQQSAGEIGSPSNQALVGHINFLSQDPEKTSGARAEYGRGSFDSDRFFGRVDTGEIAPGLTAYVTLAYQDWDVWIGEGAGDNHRLFADVKVVKEFTNGASVKFRHSHNEFNESGYNIVSYNKTPCAKDPAICFNDPFAPFNPAFTVNPNTDGYTDDWTGNPRVDRLYRPTRGNERFDNLTYIDGTMPFSEALSVKTKAYYHSQEGVGRFMNHVLEGSVPNALRAGRTDPSRPQLFYRNNDFNMDRYGAIVDGSGSLGSLVNYKAGAWYEESSRSQIRTWHTLINEAAGPEFNSAPAHTSEDKSWDNNTMMFYLSNKSKFFDDKLTFDYGFTYLQNEVDYSAPIHNSARNQFNTSSSVSLDSGLLPKFGVGYAITPSLGVFAGYAQNAASVTDAIMEEASLDKRKLPLEMDRSEVFDVGARYTTDNFAIGVQGFQIESQEIVPIDAAGTLATLNSDQGKRVQGIEVTFTGNYGQFGVFGSYTHQQHEYVLDPTDINAAGYPSRGFIKNGADLIGIPTDVLFAEVTWTPFAAFTLGANIKHVSERAGFYGNPRLAAGRAVTQDEILPEYTLFGISATYQKDNYSIGLNIENVTDERYISGVAPELLGTDSKFAGRYFIGAPQSIFVTGKVNF